MPIRRYFRDVAPYWDRYDSAFASVLAGIILLGYGTYVVSSSGPLNAGTEFLKNSGLIALLTAWTAIIALYRLRHRPDKTRPAVREDFKNRDGGDSTDFGLRNFGPGPALYIQAVATVEKDQEQEEVVKIQAHDRPIHLKEGDFVSLVHDSEDDWVSNMAEKYEISPSGGRKGDRVEPEPMVNLYFSYVSKSGARTPTDVRSDRDDTDVLDEITNPTDEPRQIELTRLANAC